MVRGQVLLGSRGWRCLATLATCAVTAGGLADAALAGGDGIGVRSVQEMARQTAVG